MYHPQPEIVMSMANSSLHNLTHRQSTISPSQAVIKHEDSEHDDSVDEVVGIIFSLAKFVNSGTLTSLLLLVRTPTIPDTIRVCGERHTRLAMTLSLSA